MIIPQSTGLVYPRGGAGWDISTAVPVRTKSLRSAPRGGVFFDSSGTRAYACSRGEQDIDQYSLSDPFNISTMSLVRSFFTGGLDFNSPQGVFFKSDGTEMYFSGDSNVRVYQRSLSTAWDISTSSATATFNLTGDGEGGFFIKPDGTELYAVDRTPNPDLLRQYTLSTAWDISSASLTGSLTLSSGEFGSSGPFLRDDGLKLYITGSTLDLVDEYDLSVAWDITTATLLQSLDVSGQDTTPVGCFFDPSGTKFYLTGDGSDDLTEYNLG